MKGITVLLKLAVYFFTLFFVVASVMYLFNYVNVNVAGIITSILTATFIGIEYGESIAPPIRIYKTGKWSNNMIYLDSLTKKAKDLLCKHSKLSEDGTLYIQSADIRECYFSIQWKERRTRRQLDYLLDRLDGACVVLKIR